MEMRKAREMGLMSDGDNLFCAFLYYYWHFGISLGKTIWNILCGRENREKDLPENSP